MNRANFLFITDKLPDKAILKREGTVNVPETSPSGVGYKVTIPNTTGYSLNPMLSYSQDGVTWYSNGSGPRIYSSFFMYYAPSFEGRAYVLGNNIVLEFMSLRGTGSKNLQYRLVGLLDD